MDETVSDETYPTISIVGATGIIGSELLNMLADSNLSGFEFRLFASEDSVGEYYEVGGDEVEVEAYSAHELDGSELVFLAVPFEVAQEIKAELSTDKYHVVDLSFTDPTESAVYCVPTVNRSVLDEGARFISVPRAYSIALSSLLSAAQNYSQVLGIHCSTYHSVSHSGKKGLDELWEQTLGVFNQQHSEQEAFAHQVAFNTVPLVDVMLEDGSTKEEKYIADEIRCLIENPKLGIDITAVRVPVFHGDGACVRLRFPEAVDLGKLASALVAQPNLVVHGHVEDCPMPADVAGNSGIHIGRIRACADDPNSCMLWLVFDGIRAARVASALQIAEDLLRAKTI